MDKIGDTLHAWAASGRVLTEAETEAKLAELKGGAK
jgi:hypothetical protein